METKSRLQKLITDFLIYCEVEKNKSQKTIIAYEHYLLRFQGFCHEQGITKPEEIDLETVRHFRLYLNRLQDARGKHLKTITQSYHVIAVRAFLKYLSKRDIETLAAEKIELPKNPSREVHPMDISQIEKIIDATKHAENEIIRLRDRAIMELLFSSGVRVSEAASITRHQINFNTGEFTVRGKGDKLRLSFVSESTAEAIKNYLKARHDNNGFLFISHSRNKSDEIGKKGEGLTARSIQRLVKKYSLLAGITGKVTPHVFRHSYATDLLQNGADIRSVQTLLGHASITTTQIYTHITNKGLREVHKKFHSKKK